MSEVKSCHYVSRFLTSPWEGKDRRLHYLDLRTKKLGAVASKTLFARDGLNSTDTERRLSAWVEAPVGKFRKRCIDGGGGLAPIDDVSVRALAAMVALQVQRTTQALVPAKARTTLDELLRDEGEFNAFVDDILRRYHLCGGTLTSNDWMAFPSMGYFMIPAMGAAPVMAVPLTPRAYVLLVPPEVDVDMQLAHAKQRSSIAGCTFAGGGIEHKIVIPAGLALAHASKQQALVELVLGIRENARKVFNLFGRMALTAGLPAYGYDDEA